MIKSVGIDLAGIGEHKLALFDSAVYITVYLVYTIC
jgi:hypothetical protein